MSHFRSLENQQRVIHVGSGLSASLVGRLESSAFRLSTTAVSMSLAGSCFSSESAPRPFHHGISKTRWNNLNRGLARQSTAGSKRTRELTSSIVPQGTSFHCSVELGFFLCCCCRGLLPGPAELSAINPDAVQDHGQPACQRNDRLLHPAPPGDLHRPGLEPGPFL